MSRHLLIILQLVIQTGLPALAFTSSNCYFGGVSRRSEAVGTTILTSAPIRKSGSLFGLTDFTTSKQTSTANVESTQPSNNNNPEEQTSSTSTVTILKNGKKITTPNNNWNETSMNEQLYTLDTLSNNNKSSQEDVDEIANSLLSAPSNDLSIDDSVVKTSGSEWGGSLESKRSRLKRDAGVEKQKITSEADSIVVENEVEMDSNKVEGGDTLEVLDESLSYETTQNDDDEEQILESRPLSPTHSIEKAASVSPTHSIQEDYEKMKMKKSAVPDDDGEEESSSSAGTKLLSELDSDGDSEHDISVVETSSSYEDKSNQATTRDKVTLLTTEQNTSNQSNEETETTQSDNIDTSSPLEAILSKATSFLSPKPPRSPPTASTIINSNSASSNLVEINAQLQQTSQNQREDLGRLRRKVNELERDLLRAKRSTVSLMEEEMNARVETIRMECEGQVVLANETVARLNEEVYRLTKELEESSKRLIQADEAKERVAAEYGFVAKAYTDAKHVFDLQKVEWEEKIHTLETDLTNVTQQLERYQRETQQWKEECANKANTLESSTARIVQMQSTIDGLQSIIKSKEEEIQRLLTTEAQEMERKLNTAKQEMRDEYEVLLSKKSRKIGEARMALRSANEKRRRIESTSQRDTAEALNKLHTEMTGEIDELKALLVEKETEMDVLKQKAQEAESIVEDRERLLAEMMFLANNLTASTQNYEDLKRSYEEETSSLRQANTDKMTEIEGLVQASNANMAKVSLLESQIGQLTVDLKKEQALKEGNEAELNDLVADLDRAETCVNELNQQLDSLKQESQTYKTKIDDLQSQIRQLEDDKASLEQTLDGERAGYESALDEKVTSIAVLERELAEKLNEFHTVNSKIEELSRQNTFEKKRADAAEATVQQIKQNVTSTVDMAEPPLEVYERKVRTLTQQNLLSQQLLNTKLSELASLKSRLDEVSDLSLFMPGEPSISDESSEIIAELKSEIEQLKVSSRQSQAQAKEKLILQNQNLAEQQDIINSLTKIVHDMDNSIADVSKQSLEKDTEGESAVNELRMKLENTTQEFSTWKAKANEKILTAENMLKSKEEQIQQLQVEIDAIITSQKDAAKTRSDADEESTMVKEKLRHKNQVIKDKDDVIEQLNKQLNDLQFEKDKVEQNLDMEVKRNEDFYHSHENQIQAMEDKLNKKHAAQVSELELEMQALKNKIVEIESAPPQIPLANNQEEQSARIKELQASLQQSKEKEVELINKNMMMKNQIDNLEAQKKLLVMSAADRNTRQENENAVELPSYYKEGKRARLRRVIGNVWRRIFRR